MKACTQRRRATELGSLLATSESEFFSGEVLAGTCTRSSNLFAASSQEDTGPRRQQPEKWPGVEGGFNVMPPGFAKELLCPWQHGQVSRPISAEVRSQIHKLIQCSKCLPPVRRRSYPEQDTITTPCKTTGIAGGKSSPATPTRILASACPTNSTAASGRRASAEKHDMYRRATDLPTEVSLIVSGWEQAKGRAGTGRDSPSGRCHLTQRSIPSALIEVKEARARRGSRHGAVPREATGLAVDLRRLCRSLQ